MLNTTVGQLLINEALPEDLRDYNRVLDKKGARELLRQVATQHPERYRDVSFRLSTIGRRVSQETGGYSFGLEHMRKSVAGVKTRQKVLARLQRILDNDDLDDKKRGELIVKVLGREMKPQQEAIYKEALAAKNPLAMQVLSGTRGNKMNLASILGSDLLYADHHDRPIPVPVLRSYAEGLSPEEYWAGAYGARKGIIATKFATQDAGFFGKQLNQVAHRLVVINEDYEDEEQKKLLRGVPVDTDDMDNEGALLAHDVGPYKKNVVLTPKILKHLKRLGKNRILVRSAMVGGSPEGGVYARDVGVRERGYLPGRGEQVGLTAAQALCLAAGTKVLMASGEEKAIEEIKAGDYVLGCSVEGVVRPVAVLALYDNGEQPCVRTVFRRGTGRASGLNLLEMTSTANHKILSEIVVRSGQADKRLPYFRHVDVRPVGTEIPEGKAAGGDRFCAKLANRFDDTGLEQQPYAFLLGLMIGGGCYSGNVGRLGFSCYDPELVDCIKEHISPLEFSLESNTPNEYRLVDLTHQTPKRREDGSWFRNRFQELLRREGMWGQTSGNKTLPLSVHRWDNPSVAALLAGLLVTDGYVIAAGGIGFSSNSYPLLYAARQLMGVRFGVWGSDIVCSRKAKKDGTRYAPTYHFTVNRQEDVNTLQHVLPVAGVKRGRLTKLLATWNSKERPAKSAPRALGRCSRIFSEAVGVRCTYDLYVAHPDHLFMLANGLVVSNSEPVSQGMLSTKHSGGVAGEEKAVSGFEYLNQLVQVPKRFKGGAAHARLDGTVQRIEPAPAGGTYVTVDGEQHYVGKGFKLKVKKGDTIEAGDVLSEGIPNPSEITRYKGIGEGRRYFTQAMVGAMRDAGMTVHRRNVELLARGLINHVRLTDEYQDHVPDDVIPYSTLEHTWKPRDGHVRLQPRQAVGKYLEAPVLHYTIGTKITPSMVKDFDEFGVREIVAHDQEPPFQPEMIRAMASLQHDPDWMTRMYGSNLKKGLTTAVHRGGTSEDLGTSFVPSLAKGVNFGRQPGAIVKQPGPGFTPTMAPDPEQEASLPGAETISAPKQRKPVSSQKWFGGRFTLSPFAQKAAGFEKQADGIPVPSGNASSAVPPPPSIAPPAIKKPGAVGGAAGPTVGGGAGYQAAAAQSAGKLRGGPPPGIPAPYSNPHAWGGRAFSSPNMINMPFAPQMVQAMNQVMPGMGGVVGLGTILNSQAMGVLMGGKRAPIYGAAGYAAPDVDTGESTGYFGGAGGHGSGAGGFYNPAAGSGEGPGGDGVGGDGIENFLTEKDDFFDALTGTTPGNGYFGPGPTNVRDALPQGVRDWIPDFVEDMVLRYTPNPLNPSRTAFGPAAALREAIRPVTGPLGRALSPAWRLPAKGVGYLPWIKNTGVGQWLQGVKSVAPKATQGGTWLSRMLSVAPGIKHLPKIPKGGGGLLTYLNIGLDAIGVGYDQYQGRQQYREGDKVDRSILDFGVSDRTLAGQQYAAKKVQDRRQAMAESTDHRVSNVMGIVGELWSPISTATQAKQLVTETEAAAKEVAQQTAENYSRGESDMARHLQTQHSGSPTYNPLDENNMTYNSVDEMWEKMKQRHKDRRERGVLAAPFLDVQDALKTYATAGAEGTMEYARLKGAAKPILQRQDDLETRRMQALEARVNDLLRRQQAGETLTSSQQGEIDRFNQLKRMTTYERVTEGQSMGQRASDDVALLRPAAPLIEPFVLPGQKWGVKRLATPMEWWRGEVSFNPFFWRSGGTYEEQMEKQQSDMFFPVLGGIASAAASRLN